MTKPVRILIADDHVIVRSGVRLLLEAEPNIEVVGEAGDGHATLSLAESLQPDIVLIDIAMPGMDGMEATRQIKSRWPDMKVLVLTMHRSDEYFFEMLRAGASGYVLKGAAPTDLIQAIQVVSQEGVFLYPAMAQRLVSSYLDNLDEDSTTASALSTREKEILKLLAAGYTNKEIAEKLVVSPSTVHSHRSNIMNKLGLSTRHELIQYARARGLLRDH